MRRAIGLVLLLAACGPDEESDTDIVIDTETMDPCEEVTFRKEGPNDPKVGDSWTVSLYCDDAFMMGPYVVRFDPSSFGTVEETTVTFTTAGTATLRVQAGSQRVETEVTVSAM